MANDYIASIIGYAFKLNKTPTRRKLLYFRLPRLSGFILQLYMTCKGVKRRVYISSQPNTIDN